MLLMQENSSIYKKGITIALHARQEGNEPLAALFEGCIFPS